jgi:hypothetical protein
MNRRDVLTGSFFAWLSLFSVDSRACILIAPPTGAELKREVASAFTKAKYVVLVEMTTPHELTRTAPTYAFAPAKWTIRRVWKGPQSIRGRVLTETSLSPCSDMGQKGRLQIFYMERLGSDTVDPKFSGALELEVTSEHVAALDALASRRSLVTSNPSLERP